MPQMQKRINFPGVSFFRLRLLSLACCLLPLFSAPVSADWYRVEVVLFEYTSPDADNEWWYENPGLPGRHQTIELLTDMADPVPGETPEAAAEEDLSPYLALPKTDYRLGGVRRVLEASGEYRPLLHVAWQQPGLGSREIRAIHLDNTQFEEKPPEQVEAEPGEVSYQPEYTPPVKVYDGIVRLRKSRFLHLDVDFAYFPDRPGRSEPALPEGTDGAGRLVADYVRMTESRRIKPDELNYFDHPLFGLIIQVTRVEFEDTS